ncbi:methylamine dehydrogenase light chain [Emcibacter nanhaiensis]|uniref:Methylamine dehydrogenase (amicyanin) n=1 Tax=Emcibacter nanhaiensis TaxID=1505037 RepID=A0A501PGP3_9PROT|nr:methylamine dehydrogenase light chain [Emcibacter nanhaiensis]TPD59124.1 methylamine dehydrogenase (amicyanin) light chain [Emcibacter nanhaiensis]
MSILDKLTEKMARKVAQKSSRRGFLAGFGTALVGATAFPVLPVARASTGATGGYPGVAPQSTGNPEDPGDPTSCDYWRYCAIDGFLCSCCGGSQSACPPGTEMSPITWIGTCQNPADGKNYIISYNDCCGKTSCGRCMCNRNEGDRPMVRPQANNDTNWCLGTESSIYTCSTAVVIGLALEQ